MGINGVVSVIVPVYNTAPWLRRCLDSICAQSFRNLEILCVNDGSTDNSAEILAEYAAKDARIKVFTQENAGLSAARNTALEHATGEWVAGVDSDDSIEPETFEHAMACITQEVDMVAFGMRCVWDNGTAAPSIFQQFSEDADYPMSVEQAASIHVCFCNKLWRRSVIEEHAIRFPTGLIHEDDAFFYQFIPYARRIALCSYVGYNYLQRAGSIVHSGQSQLETARRYILVMRYVFEQYSRRGIKPAESPWFQLFVSRVYADRYHTLPQAEYPALAELFYTLLLDLNMWPEWKSDYRFRRMKPVRGWRRLFLSRYLNTELWRFLGVPVWQVDYPDGREAQHHFIFLLHLYYKFKSLFRRA